MVGGAEEEVERTTPEAIDLQATFRRMLDGGDRACAMEVSSHALALHRCDAVHFELALFTNLTQDHLDFHGNMEEYFRSKRMLFEMGPGSAVVNVDDPYGRRIAGEFECLTFSVAGAAADYAARDVSFDAGGAEFTIAGPSGETPVRTALPGHFNVANALGAFAAATVLGVDPETAAAGLARAGAGAGALRAGGAGPGVRGARRLRPYPRLAGERAAGGTAADRRPADRRPRRRR